MVKPDWGQAANGQRTGFVIVQDKHAARGLGRVAGRVTREVRDTSLGEACQNRSPGRGARVGSTGILDEQGGPGQPGLKEASFSATCFNGRFPLPGGVGLAKNQVRS